VLTKIEDIDVDPRLIIYDDITEIFRKIYANERPVALTRMDTDQICPGKLDLKTGEILSNLEILKPHIDTVINGILRGERPSVYVYMPNRESQHSWYAPDDELVLEAYKNLGIISVPVILMNRFSKHTLEGKIEVIAASNDFTKLHQPKQLTHIDAIQPPNEFTEHFIEVLERQCSDTIALIPDTDAPNVDHHVAQRLYCSELKNFSRAIGELAMKGFLTQTFALLRQLYEFITTSYIDWLNPEKLASRRQLSSLLANFKHERDVKESLGNFGQLFRSTKQKSLLCPFSHSIHSSWYPILSEHAHADYSATYDKESSTYLSRHITTLTSMLIAYGLNLVVRDMPKI